MGLSKFARLVQVYAKRIQSQEHLTQTLLDIVMREVNPHGAAVVIEAHHITFLSQFQDPVRTFLSAGCFDNGGGLQEVGILFLSENRISV